MALISSTKVYTTLKWADLVFLPAALTFYGLVAATLSLPHTQDVLTIGAGFITFLGIVLGVSNAQFKAENK